MVNVIASITIKEGHSPEFIEILKSNIPDVLKEKGCLAYAPTVDLPTGLPIQALDENVITIIEKWEHLEDLNAHLSAPHMVTYRERVKSIVDKISIKVLQEV